jgi:hypothetical protein
LNSIDKFFKNQTKIPAKEETTLVALLNRKKSRATRGVRRGCVSSISNTSLVYFAGVPCHSGFCPGDKCSLGRKLKLRQKNKTSGRFRTLHLMGWSRRRVNKLWQKTVVEKKK